MKLKTVQITLAVLAILCVTNVSAYEVPLYDGSQNTTPDEQKWFSNFMIKQSCDMCFPPFCTGDLQELCDKLNPGTAVQSAADGVTNLDTTADMSKAAGYFTTVPPLPSPIPPVSSELKMPVLDRAAGFTVTFEVQIVAEEHLDTEHGNDRAGFSIIVNSSDCSETECKAVELGFWTNEIWAQSDGKADEYGDLFKHAEGTGDFDTTGMKRYELKFLGDTYSLYADGSESPVLTGPLRDYHEFEDPLYAEVYQTPNFIFVGDDTTSAKANINLKSLSLTVTIKGDMNDNGSLGIDDGIIALQVCDGENPPNIPEDYASLGVDANGDKKIGLEDAAYIFREISKE